MTRVASYPKKILHRRVVLPPDLGYNPELPIMSRKDDIVRTIKENQVTIITGETGSGKTTQLPKMCLEAGRGTRGLIGCTQPRRVAAVTVAHRIAEEFRENIGQSVGYKIRFDEKMGASPLIKVMTDGILLIETQRDRLLRQYDTIIVDEAHERSLNIDFVLGILKSVLLKRPDLKVIITSATLDTEKFSQSFDKAPIIEVSGRMYSVKVRYHPIDPEQEESGELTYIDAAVDAITTIREERQRGDILVFMPTEQDIWETCEILQGRHGDQAIILPLFARLPWHEQRRVFLPATQSRIIVATNIAETSVTIPDIRYVIDTGLARMSQYSARSRSTSLPIRPVSRSSADQRMGRCGRVSNGLCIRLYSEEDYLQRPLYTAPEIMRANLAGVILQMLYLQIGEIFEFPFIDQPLKKNITDAIDILLELGAIQKTDKDALLDQPHSYMLTSRGRIMARLPIDPRVSRMLIEGGQRGCAEEVSVIASALSIVDPRERPADKKAQSDQMHAPFKDPTSDFMTLLRIWDKFHTTLESLKSQNRVRKFCREHFLSYRRIREWRDVHKQLTDILAEEKGENVLSKTNLQVGKPDDKHTAIHKSILSGYLGNIAEKKEKNLYHGAKGREPMIFPGSALINRGSQWIVAAEMVETSRLFARVVANIQPDWIEEIGKEFCRYTYSDPHWEKNREDVVASEKVSIFGLTIVPGRAVSFSRINPEEASTLFIRQGLMPGELKSRFPFLQNNLALIERLQEMENKTRRHDLIDEESIFHFYAVRLAGVANTSSLRKLIHRRGGDHFLHMKEADILLRMPDYDALSAYPDHAIINGIALPLTYHFDPGQIHDGITLKIPSALLSNLSVNSLDWTVPGILREKIYSLLKSLPKEFRKKLPPALHLCDIMMAEMKRGEGSLLTAMGRFILDRFDIAIPVAAWPSEQISDHLKMFMVVVNGKDQVLSSSRKIEDLQKSVIEEESAAFENARQLWERRGLTDWNFGDLPETIALESCDSPVGYAFPGLNPVESGVDLRLFKTHAEALDKHSKGVGRLYEIFFTEELRHLRKSLSMSGKMKEWASALGGAKNLEKQLYQKVVHDLLALPVRTQAEWRAHGQTVRKKLLPYGQEVVRQATPVVEAMYAVHTVLDRLEKANIKSSSACQFISDVRQEIGQLVPPSFLKIYDKERLSDIIRYLRAHTIRAERGLLHLEKAMGKTAEARIYSDKLRDLRENLPAFSSQERKAATAHLSWMIEEYKVSLFAQELKTRYPISKKRLDEKIKEIEMME